MKYLALIPLLLIVACAQQPVITGTNPVFDTASDVGTSSFSSEEDFVLFLASAQDGGYGGGMMRGGIAVMESADMATGAPAPMAADSKATDFSGTNNQVQTVDEADILKTDGEYIYTITGQTLFIIRAYPGEDAEIVSTITFTGQPQGIFIDGDRMAIFGGFYDTQWFSDHGIRPRSGMTFVDVYDISDRTAPALMKEYKLEGQYAHARMTDGVAYLIITSYPDAGREFPMPYIIEDDAVRTIPVDDIYRFPYPYRSIELVTTHALEMADGEIADAVSVAVDGYPQIYMDEERLYLATTQYVDEWEIRQDIMQQLVNDDLSIDDREIIKRIQRTDARILSSWEKRSKIQQVYDEHVQYLPEDERALLEDKIDSDLKTKLETYESREYTVLNAINLNGGRLAVGPSGKIAGSIYGQFAMDAHDGVLRVATTLSPMNTWWGIPVDDVMFAGPAEESAGVAVDAKMIAPEPMRTVDQTENRVYTLDDQLRVLDTLEGIAPGERIFSARFIGDRLYLVTFRQVDPFFVIDLSNPSDIRELGQLKVPGFSRYLHPYDDDIIIGIGRDASDTGRQQGLKISLFDVSDVSKPKEIAKWVASSDYASSAAEWEHKAFLFSKEKDLLVIPGYSYDWQSSTNRYNGAMVFRITPSRIEMRGVIDHSTGTTQWYAPQVERSLYIEDLLYTKSPGMLRINELSDLSSVKRIDLDAKSVGPYPIY